MTQTSQWKPLKDLATAVGAKVRVRRIDGIRTAVLYSAQDVELVTEYDIFDMLDSIRVYYGSHPDYAAAIVKFNYATGEEA